MKDFVQDFVTGGHAYTNSVLMSAIGMTWVEIAKEHDMRCGRCRDGVLHLSTVRVTLTIPPLPPEWFVLSETRVQWSERFACVAAWAKPTKTVTLELICDTCGAQMEMPLHAREE